MKVVIQKPNYIYEKANSSQAWHLKNIGADNQEHLEILPPFCLMILYSATSFALNEDESVSNLVLLRFVTDFDGILRSQFNRP